jgi:hypothetical protein
MYVMKGFSFETLYNMPVYLRNFYINELNRQKEEEMNELEKMKSKR